MDGYGPASYGDAMADVYDHWYADVSDVGATVDRLAVLAGTGPVLELGVGSGRLAIPLAARGVEVWGIDASAAMVERLRAKPGGDRVQVSIGDMAELALDPGPAGPPPPFTVVFAAYNTLFNLPSRAAQAGCLRRAAALLGPDGRVVVEAFVPAGGATAGGSVAVRSIELGRVVLSVSHHDPRDQAVVGQYVELSESGIRLRPWCLRYLTPAQLDELAGEAGLGLVERRGGWRDEPFDDAASSHVSVYARPASACFQDEGAASRLEDRRAVGGTSASYH